MNPENLKKALFLYFTSKIGSVKGKEILEKGLWDRIDFRNSEIQKQVEKEIKMIEQKKAKVVTLLDENYPALLREIYNPPLILFYYGDLRTNFPVAVVGTRTPSKYGEKTCQTLVRDLCRYPVEIISGFANGIDSIAHREVLANCGRTFAVMGCGLDINYPASNQKIRSEILENGGALISEYSFGTPPEAFRFPARNRIISGLSSGVIVIEASVDSGAIITAKTANEQGRSVFTIPGSLFQDSFSGNHALLRQGATLVRSAEDILNDLSVYQKEKPQKKTAHQEKPKKDLLFGEEEKLIFQMIKEPVSLDEIMLKTGFAPSKILSLLTQLCIKEVVEERGGLYYQT